MNELDYSNILVLLLAGMLVWACANVLIAIIRLNRTYDLTPNRFIYPANCKPEHCRDVVGFVSFMTPRLLTFGILGVILAAFYVVNELTGLFSFLPDWFSSGVSLFLFIPLFVWYVIFINKAAKRFW